MSVDAKRGTELDTLAAARDRMAVGPIPEWVVACPYEIGFKSKAVSPATHLLLDRQVHAERHETFVHVALRLETMQAVQHYSQWRLEFSPATQSVRLHSIKIRRGDVETEQAKAERIQILRRETGLDEGFVIDGWATLLLLLEDVRPGDILEWSYTVQGGSGLLPDRCAALFDISENIHLGKHHLFVRFSEARPMAWASSSTDFRPVEKRENGEKHWTWLREDIRTDEREPGTPTWYVPHPWIQISDCSGWWIVSKAFWDAWKQESANEALASQIREIESAETDVARKVNRAIQYVQDEFRYLSVNLELGGQVPADSETVIRRRYGDCKDLALLLTHLLRGLGIIARPVLVNTFLQRTLGIMLPSPNLFNHAVVEYRIGSERRWVDATIKGQGGDALHRSIPDYGVGLLVDENSTALVSAPASTQPAVYELKERYLVDTTGDSSYLAITIRAQGFYAENLRMQFANEGAESVARKRLEACALRFPEVKRVDALQYRDDREINEFVLSETFEVNGFLLPDASPGYCWIPIQNWALAGTLPVLPEKQSPRKMPLALPYPSKVIHTFEIESLGLDVVAVPAHQLRCEFFDFKGTGRGVRKFTTATFTLTTLRDAIAVSRIEEYQKQITLVMNTAWWKVRLPIGYARMRRRGDFGALPSPARAPLTPKPDATPAAGVRPLGQPSPKRAVVNEQPAEPAPMRNARPPLENVVLKETQPRPDRDRPRKVRRSRFPTGNNSRKIEIIAIIIVALFFAIYALLSFKLRGP